MVFDAGFVHENVALIFSFYETVSFFLTIPFNPTFSHRRISPFSFYMCSVSRNVTSEEGQKHNPGQDRDSTELVPE
jgi:hypothetical protein